MPIAAVPKYLGTDFSDASPGLRFGMYLQLWGVDSRTGQHLWETHDRNYRATGRDRTVRAFEDDNKTGALKRAAELTSHDREVLNGLRSRQRAIFGALREADACAFVAKSIAPFTAGLGNEHPLENGFAFLNPYGLPYLPGSGVKGALRRAAEELARADFFGGSGKAGAWTLPDIWRLFGFEPRPGDKGSRRSWEEWVGGFAVDQAELDNYLDAVLPKDTPAGRTVRKRLADQDDDVRRLRVLLGDSTLHVSGALDFWDVIPDIAEGRLAVEIMTPHHSHYYQSVAPQQGSVSPHDSGSPNPISFLTVPAGSEFTFHVRCDMARLHRVAPELERDKRWRGLLEAAFDHAFTWLGFGAKTAVGYGAMERNREREARERTEREARVKREREERQRDRRLAEMDPLDRAMAEVIENRTDKGMPEITALIKAIEAGRWTGPDKVEAAGRVRTRMQKENCWKETSQKRNPSKDKDYKNTKRVKRCLGEE